jgi:hypothetical protein
MAADSRAIDMDASEEIETKRDALPRLTRHRGVLHPLLLRHEGQNSLHQ